MAFELTPERLALFEELLPKYPTRQALTIPLLHICQEQHGYITPEIVAFVAKRLGLTTADVQGVVTFYTLFQQKPTGRNVLWVCRTLSCELMGARPLQKHIEETLGIHAGETTEDGEFTLFTAECLAACGQGPMMQLNDEYHENLTPERVDALLAEARRTKDARCKATHGPIGIRSRASK